jgi:hypothetical protein
MEVRDENLAGLYIFSTAVRPSPQLESASIRKKAFPHVSTFTFVSNSSKLVQMAKREGRPVKMETKGSKRRSGPV